jgi:hypothetical protein
MKRLAFALSLVLLAGCVTGAHLVTGNPHPKLVVEAVKVYQTTPRGAEVIGTVVAQSLGADQCALDRSLAELKRQAARIGANGIVPRTPTFTPGGFLTDPTTQLSAQAIYVP